MHMIGGADEDGENDASLACSSGKNSRRKNSLLSRSNKKENKACNNAPRKKAQHQASARYL